MMRARSSLVLRWVASRRGPCCPSSAAPSISIGSSTPASSSLTTMAMARRAAAVSAAVQRLQSQWAPQEPWTFSAETGGALPTHDEPPPPVDPPVRKALLEDLAVVVCVCAQLAHAITPTPKP